MTHKKLATKSGISPWWWSKIYNGHQRASLNIRKALSTTTETPEELWLTASQEAIRAMADEYITNAKPAKPRATVGASEKPTKSLKQLAGASGITPRHLSRLLSGARRSSWPTACRLAANLGMSPDHWMNMDLATILYAIEKYQYGRAISFEEDFEEEEDYETI